MEKLESNFGIIAAKSELLWTRIDGCRFIQNKGVWASLLYFDYSNLGVFEMRHSYITDRPRNLDEISKIQL